MYTTVHSASFLSSYSNKRNFYYVNCSNCNYSICYRFERNSLNSLNEKEISKAILFLRLASRNNRLKNAKKVQRNENKDT